MSMCVCITHRLEQISDQSTSHHRYISSGNGIECCSKGHQKAPLPIYDFSEGDHAQLGVQVKVGHLVPHIQYLHLSSLFPLSGVGYKL